MSIYTDMKTAGLELDNHYSDLYVEDTPKTREILKKHHVSWSMFQNACNGKMWIDVPFMHEPFWDDIREREAKRKELDQS